jgi:hypothetical protein
MALPTPAFIEHAEAWIAVIVKDALAQFPRLARVSVEVPEIMNADALLGVLQ